MTKWTKEQLEAIEKDGTNIIVSAGAGSGKTAVLSERVIHKLKNGIHIDELLILTFTRAAAEEMKNRIRKKIKSDDTLKEELNRIDSSYITTFDSFALSILKKYHYILNIPKDIKITNESYLKIQANKILDDVFEKYYSLKDDNFEELIDKYCLKNDNSLKENIKLVISKIENSIDKKNFLNYLENDFYKIENIKRIENEYWNFIEEKRKTVGLNLNAIRSYFDYNYMEKIENLVMPIITAEMKDIMNYSSIKLPPVPKGTEEEAKEKKNNLKSSLDDLFKYAIYNDENEIINNILESQPTVKTIVDIIKNFFQEYESFKNKNNLYTFQDIAILAIKIIKENENIRKELSESFKEIMVDEYQDTNDIQETFINLIAQNNIYMVGDIKQSIYRFRGSNPYIFKNKYDNYSKNISGYKIDLVKNFRSRDEVLSGINLIFDLIMDNKLGGAEYYESHEMKYGNTLYDIEKDNNANYNCEILEYNNSTNDYSNIEIEIFTIAKDIQEKIKNNYQVFDKETSKLRPITYSDFVIILDRSKYFDSFKKIFEYLNIPLTILREGALNANVDLILIKNIIDLIIRINKGDYNEEFKFDFLSIGRSFLYEHDDQYLFDIMISNKYKETDIYKDFSNIKNLYSKNVSTIYKEILNITKFYEKIYKIGDYNNINVRISSLFEIAKNLENMNVTIEDFKSYLDEIINNDYEIKYNEFNESTNSVKILTIHKSKGLEYPICYYSDLDHDFNISDLKSKLICDEKYGLIIPSDLLNEKESILKILYKNEYKREELSEKIRLFYVALTRAREKMIIVLPEKEITKFDKNENGTIEYFYRLQFSRISHLIYAIKPYLKKYFNVININELNLTKNYLYNKIISDNSIEENSEDFIVEEINIPEIKIEESHFSKSTNNLITKENYQTLKFGTQIHEIMEYIDFKNFNNELIENNYIKDKITWMLSQDIFKNIKDAKIYKEYEFIDEDNNKNKRGIIDLMLEYSDHIDIIDYKLKNINDENYSKQLLGYKNYIQKKYKKKTECYLYSIIDKTTKKVF